jgi:hypothetical protein
LQDEAWYLSTSQSYEDWPDSWALVRDWKPIDPAEYPTDVVHQMSFGDAVVRDVVGFHPDGTAVARRLLLADKAAEWSQSGSAATVANSVTALATPHGCCLDPGYSELRWESLTTRVLAYFRARDWHLSFLDDGGGLFQYTHGVGSAELDRPRFRQGQMWEPLGIRSLSCQVTPELDMRFTGWRVQTGCAAHRGTRQAVGFHDPRLAGVMDALESAATTSDLAALAYCVVYGDCSTRELDLSHDD